MPKKIRLYDIDWDTGTDESDPVEVAEEPQLPLEVTIEVNKRWDPTEEAADYLSDNYGFCVNGCKWEEVNDG